MNIAQLPFKKNMKVMEVVLPEDLYVEQWIVPKGTLIRTKEGRNFGFVILSPNTQDKRGFTIPRQLFSY
jgi:hypothetical protein